MPFEGSLCPEKTSYPTNRHYLYYSGSELSFADVAPPAPRGHRARRARHVGAVLFDRLAQAVRVAGVRVLPQTRAVSLVTDDGGRVTGVECLSLQRRRPGPGAATGCCTSWARSRSCTLGGLGRRLHRPVAWLERRQARPLRVGARRGVVIAAGGFVANRAMLREHAPAYRGGLALGTVADDGSGIRLGVDAGGATRFLDRVSCWRFITPPSAFLRGIIVDQAGQRICDESRYGAAIGEAMVTRRPARLAARSTSRSSTQAVAQAAGQHAVVPAAAGACTC